MPLPFTLEINIKDNCDIDLFRFTKKDKNKHKTITNLKKMSAKKDEQSFHDSLLKNAEADFNRTESNTQSICIHVVNNLNYYF